MSPSSPAARLPDFYAQPTLIRRPAPVLTEAETGAVLRRADAEATLESLHQHDRYELVRHIGSGSSSEVFRVRDLHLERFLAMKVLRPGVAEDPAIRGRFLSEARTMARLQHPGILPVYDMGDLADGRPFFTMQEVTGDNLGQLLHRRAQIQDLAERWPLSRLLTVFRQACAIVSFAHGRRVLHLDIKPENLLIGDEDAVYVVDWGLTSTVGERRRDLLGTPAFLAPEQLDPSGQRLDPRVDVYALGAVLYQLFAGRPPYTGSPRSVLRAVQQGPPESLQAVAPSVPAPLLHIVERAMARLPGDRFPSARQLGRAVDAWLDGTQTRQRVHRLVELAESRVEDARLLQGQARQLRSRLVRLQAMTATWSPESTKHRLWDLEDRADLLEREGKFKLLERRQLLHAAATQAPDMPEPHVALAECFREDHDAAEARGDEASRRMAEERLREHLAALPEDHPIRSEFTTWLEGMGALTLTTTEPEAELFLERFANFRRRLRVVSVRSLGMGAVADVALPTGSYRLRISAPGCAEVLLPLRIARGGRWHNVHADGADDVPLFLPPANALGSGDRYVPAGMTSLTSGVGTKTPVWVDGFVLQANPVTNADFLAFLDDLLDRGELDEAKRWAPRMSNRGGLGPLTWARGPDGHYALPPANPRQAWRADAPVVGVTWHAARAYARWLAERTGQAWRLPHEVEWEKAARGTDARHFPWGAGADPARACIWSSRQTSDGPASVADFTADESPYGCRHMAGNVHEWCGNVYQPRVPIEGGRLVWPDVGDVETRAARGASWRSRGLEHALSQRQGLDPDSAEDRVGFRLARSIGPTT